MAVVAMATVVAMTTVIAMTNVVAMANVIPTHFSSRVSRSAPSSTIIFSS